MKEESTQESIKNIGIQSEKNLAWTVYRSPAFDKSLRKVLKKLNKKERKKVINSLQNFEENYFNYGKSPRGSHPVETKNYGKVQEVHVSNMKDILLYFKKIKNEYQIYYIKIADHSELSTKAS